MRLLLTSAGIHNPTIHAALVDLLGRPIEDCTALCIPTAMYGHPHAGPGTSAWEFVAGRSEQPMVELGWRSVGLLELTALPSIGVERSHLDHPDLPENTMADAETSAARLDCPSVRDRRRDRHQRRRRRRRGRVGRCVAPLRRPGLALTGAPSGATPAVSGPARRRRSSM